MSKIMNCGYFACGILIAFLAAVSSGCTAPVIVAPSSSGVDSDALGSVTFRTRLNASSRYHLDDVSLAAKGLTSPVSLRWLSFRHDLGNSPVPLELAQLVDDSIGVALGRVGITEVADFELALISEEFVPATMSVSLDGLVFPIFVVPGASVREVVRGNLLGIDLIVHEVIESTLVDPHTSLSVMGDLRRSDDNSIFRSGGTRWFRDGLANYVSLLAAQHTAQATGLPLGESAYTLRNLRPFGSLEKVGMAIFDWSNWDEVRGANPASDPELYAASLAVFLLAAENGDGVALVRWLKILEESSRGGGSFGLTTLDIELAYREAFGASLRDVVRNFSTSTTHTPSSWLFTRAKAMSLIDDPRTCVSIPSKIISLLKECGVDVKTAGGYNLVFVVGGYPVTCPLEFDWRSSRLLRNHARHPQSSNDLSESSVNPPNR